MQVPDHAKTEVTRKGKVLRVKTGYNPNSSSVASELTIFLFVAMGAGALTVAGLSVADLIVQKMRKAPKAEPAAAPAEKPE